MQDKLSLGAERFIQAVNEFIFVEDQPEKADVIFVPGSRKIENAIRAAELYKAGYAPYVLPSGRFSTLHGRFLGVPEKYAADYPDEYATEWEFYRAVLLKHGVPDEAILRDDQATYTWRTRSTPAMCCSVWRFPAKQQSCAAMPSMRGGRCCITALPCRRQGSLSVRRKRPVTPGGIGS